MRLTARLSLVVVVALGVSILLGFVLVRVTGSPLIGLLVGLGAGVFIATAIVVRTIQAQMYLIAPPQDIDSAKENR